jgi:hypothetical protein
MQLTKYILDLGRPVAYYPGLKALTGSTTASILLCQLLYWTPRVKKGFDGWIYKNSFELEEETGLTVYEQRTARRILVDKGLILEDFKNFDHSLIFKVNEEELNRQWEEVTRGGSKLIEQVAPEEVPATPKVTQSIGEFQGRETVKKGDLLDGILDAAKTPGFVKMQEIISIKNKIEKRLHIVADDKKWDAFFEFVYHRQVGNNESIDKFLDWATKKDNFDPMYLSAAKLKMLWPQAFIVEDKYGFKEDFVEKLPARQPEKIVAPMPKDIGLKKDF